MPDMLAWSAWSTFEESFAGSYSPVSVQTYSIPPITDLGPFAMLVCACSGRSTCQQESDFNWNYTLGTIVTVAGDDVSYDRRTSSGYDANLTVGAPHVGEKMATSKANTFKYDFAPGATVEVTITFGGDYRLEGVFTVALLRDISGLNESADWLGGQSRRIYPGTVTPPDPAPLTAAAITDPAPYGILGVYASDSWSGSTPPAVTIENTPGWEDLTSATAMGLRVALGLYAPQATAPPPSGYVTPAPTITGVTGTQASEMFDGISFVGNALLAPVVSIPSKLATIVG